MLDMVDYKAISYAANKHMEREQEIRLLITAASCGESLMRIRDCARRIHQLRTRTNDYDQALVACLSGIRSSKVISNSAKTLKKPEETIGAAVVRAVHYYRCLFHSTEGRQMLDKWDAEDAAMKETANA